MSHYVRITRKTQRSDERGTVYLVHFHAPFIGERRNPNAKKDAVALHYLGWTRDLESRLADHRAGNGSALMAAVSARGIEWSVARTWENATRTRERQLKNQGSARRLCPLCKATAA